MFGTVIPQIPKLQEFRCYPAVLLITLLIIGITVAWWAKVDVSCLFETAEIRRGQLWRLFTGGFIHGDILHLAFNLYWLWVFAPSVEKNYGKLNFILLILLFGIGSGALEFAFDEGGIGFSGVLYGLFGMLWIVARYDDRFRDFVNKDVSLVFFGLFVICIFARYVFQLNIGNIAHAAGLALGVLVGCYKVSTRAKYLLKSCIVCFVLLSVLGATIFRPVLNKSDFGGRAEAGWGYEALQAHDFAVAVWWLRDAVVYRSSDADSWHNLGLAYQALGDSNRAELAFHEAQALRSNKSESAVPTKK